MKIHLSRILFWPPRVLGLLFAAFVSMFALDVFGAGYNAWETLIALLMHLRYTFVLLAALIIPRRWEWLSGVFFWSFAAWYLTAFWGQFDWLAYLLLAGPPIVIGALFLIDWAYYYAYR